MRRFVKISVAVMSKSNIAVNTMAVYKLNVFEIRSLCG